MAFLQTRPPQTRRVSGHQQPLQVEAAHVANASQLDDQQVRILFGPVTDAATTISYLTTASDSQFTPVRSHSAADLFEGASNSAVDELDQLDSHLPGFRRADETGVATPILPTHDGYGSFRLDNNASRLAMERRLYAFEQHNPARVKRRRESMELAQRQLEYEQTRAEDLTRRIEQWRTESGRIILAQDRNASKRRRVADDLSQDSSAASTLTVAARQDVHDWHEQDGSHERDAQDDNSLWTRLTRLLLHDVLGMETVGPSSMLSSLRLSSHLPQTPSQLAASLGQDGDHETHDDSSWQLRIIDCVARDLGSMVARLSAHPHPGAFSTYQRMQAMPIPYAGLPIIRETANAIEEDKESTANHGAAGGNEASVPTVPLFQPTVQCSSNVEAQRKLEIDHNLVDEACEAQQHDSGGFTQQEWEQDLDIKLVFRYLRNRFTRDSSEISSVKRSVPTNSQDWKMGTARVAQHHPLVTHGLRNTQRDHRLAVRGIGAGSSVLKPIVHHIPASSCGSQSARRLARRGSASVSSRHSSRPYWDVGGSIGTGSLVGSVGPLGSWADF